MGGTHSRRNTDPGRRGHGVNPAPDLSDTMDLHLGRGRTKPAGEGDDPFLLGADSTVTDQDQGHSHSHGHGGRPAPASHRSRMVLSLLLVPLFAATVLGGYLLWPAGARAPVPDALLGPDGRPVVTVNGTLLRSQRGPCTASLPPGTDPTQLTGPAAQACVDYQVLVTSGPDAGATRTVEQAYDPTAPAFHAGDKVRLGRSSSAGGNADYQVSDYQRGRPLGLLAIAFAVMVVLVARWRGLAALAGMAFTYLALVYFLLPALLDGRSPLAVSLVGASGVLFVLLYLAHGPSARTSAALLGTLASLGLTGALGYAAIGFTRLTGLGSDDSNYLHAFAGKVSLTGLVLAGLIIGSLGLLNDVTVTQASAVWELAEARLGAHPRELFRAGMRIGRDHIASSVYTIMLAYAGAALPSLLLFALADRSAYDVVTGDLVAAEVVRTAVGGIGLVASVPITTGIAALIAGGRPAAR
jgi:uncharacterized membrane protein